jgi:hypothetical protein
MQSDDLTKPNVSLVDMVLTTGAAERQEIIEHQRSTLAKSGSKGI